MNEGQRSPTAPDRCLRGCWTSAAPRRLLAREAGGNPHRIWSGSKIKPQSRPASSAGQSVSLADGTRWKWGIGEDIDICPPAL